MSKNVHTAIHEAIKNDILNKLDEIREKLITDKEAPSVEKIQFLAIVSDEVDDVLLNWSERVI